MPELHRVVLASVSPRRYELLTSLGLHVIVRPSGVVEGDRPGNGPRELAAAHAAAKADAVARVEDTEMIVAADTVVDLDGRAIGKPGSPSEAQAMLQALSGREHLVHSAYTVIGPAGAGRFDGVRTTAVRFAPLSAATIEAYVASGEPMDKAGAYGIQGRGAALVERIDGDFYTVMGFPLGDFVRRLPEIGFVLGPAAAIGAAP